MDVYKRMYIDIEKHTHEEHVYVQGISVLIHTDELCKFYPFYF